MSTTPPPDRPTPETDAAAIRHCANWSNHGDHVREIVFADFARSLERQHNEAREEITTLERNLGKALSVQRQYFNDFQREQAHRVAKEEEMKGLLEDLKTALRWIDDGIDEEGDQEGRDLIVKPMMAKHFNICEP